MFSFSSPSFVPLSFSDSRNKLSFFFFLNSQGQLYFFCPEIFQKLYKHITLADYVLVFKGEKNVCPFFYLFIYVT